jgi:hypothetical protein
VPGGEGGVEGEHVHLGAGQIEGELAGGGSVEAGGFGTESAAEVVEAAAQAGEGLAFGMVGPEGAGEPGTLEGDADAEGEQRQEPLPLLGAQGREGLAVDVRFEGPEEAQDQWRGGVVR